MFSGFWIVATTRIEPVSDYQVKVVPPGPRGQRDPQAQGPGLVGGTSVEGSQRDMESPSQPARGPQKSRMEIMGFAANSSLALQGMDQS